MRRASRLRTAGLQTSRRRSFTLVDAGDSGYEHVSLVPKTRDTSTFALMDRQQPGSRIYLIDPVAGDDSTGKVLFYDGTNLIDSTGSTTGKSGLAYGTDPKNPNLSAIYPFKRWAYVCQKDVSSTTESLGNTSNDWIGVANMSPASAFRAGKPDWWLFLRGATCNLYTDLRGFLDDTGRTATAITRTHMLTHAGGESATYPAVIGAYGPTSLGRARVTHANYAFMGRLNSTGVAASYYFYFGLFCDGSDRERPLRPVDWTTFADPDTGYTPALFRSMHGTARDYRVEDCMFLAGNSGVEFTTNSSHTTPVGTRGADFDWKFYRNIIADAWGESKFLSFSGTKGAGDPAQTFAANATAAITFPTGTSADWDGTTFTVPAGWDGSTVATSYYAALQYLFDVTATINVGGTLRVGLFVDGVETQTKTFSGTGVSSDLYKVYGVFRTPQSGLGWDSGTTVEIRVTTTNASGTISVAGANTARLRTYRVSATGGGCQGLYAEVKTGSRYKMTENVLVRNGFSTDPSNKATTLPDGNGLYLHNILNHNIYTVGDADLLGCEESDNVFLVASAGEVLRNPMIFDRNFVYSGYVSYAPEHHREWTTTTGHKRDNVIQTYKAVNGHTSHLGTGFLICNGALGEEITGNIKSDAQHGGVRGMNFDGQRTPYNVPSQMFWRNDTKDCTVSDNIIDLLGTAEYSAVILEGNGTNASFNQFLTPITYSAHDWPTSAYQVGDVATCTPVAGYSGTPSYQWYRYNDTLDTTTRASIAGATNSSYTLTASDIGTASDGTRPAGWSRVECVVTGITYPAGYGVSNNSGSGNILVKSGAVSAHVQYSMNGSSNPPTGGSPSCVTFAPAGSTTAVSSDLTYTGLTLTGTTSYTSLANAQSGAGGSNWNATLKTALQSFGITVSSSDGMQEYIDNVVARSNSPTVNAWRRGRWDTRLLRGVLNHVRTGRGKSAL